MLGLGYYVAGEYDEAARWGRKALEENPRYTANLRFLAASLAAAGHTDEARGVSQALLVARAGIPGRSLRRALCDPGPRSVATGLAQHLRSAGLPG